MNIKNIKRFIALVFFLSAFLAISSQAFAADRYWVGGAGNWSDTAHWSDADGGSGGFSIPTSADNVYFSAGSFSVDGNTVTIDTTANTNSLDFSGIDQTMTLTNTAYNLNVYGDFILSIKLSTSFTGVANLYLKATTSVNIKTNGSTTNWRYIYIDGVGGKWTLQDDTILNGETKLYNGELDTNNKIYSTSGMFSFNPGTSKKLTLGSSLVTFGNGLFFYNISNNIVDAGTSTIKVNGDWFEGGRKDLLQY